MSYTIGIDGGEKNFAYAVVDVKRVVCLEIGMIEATIVNMTPHPMKVGPKGKLDKKTGKRAKRDPRKQSVLPAFKDTLSDYIITIAEILRDYDVRVKDVYSERFQTRGVKSRSVETVSFMNGIVATLCYANGVHFQPTIAATWKNRVNKVWARHAKDGLLPLEVAYGHATRLGFTNHELDSTLIAFTRGGSEDPPAIKRVLRAMQQYAKEANNE